MPYRVLMITKIYVKIFLGNFNSYLQMCYSYLTKTVQQSFVYWLIFTKMNGKRTFLRLDTTLLNAQDNDANATARSQNAVSESHQTTPLTPDGQHTEHMSRQKLNYTKGQTDPGQRKRSFRK